MPKPSVLATLASLVVALSLTGPAHAATSRTNIDTLPTGATVILLQGGVEKVIGITPMKLYRLPRGPQQLILRKDGYVESRQNLTIAARVDTFVFTLDKQIVNAKLELLGGPTVADGKVTIDGREVGVVPGSFELTPGRHQVVVEKPGFTRWMRWIEADQGQHVTFDVVLAAVEAAKGQLLVSSNPSGASIRLNGSPVGVSPTVIAKLDPGSYLVELVLDGYLSWSKTVEVVSDQSTTVDAALEQSKRPTGDLKVLVSGADGAEVFVDGTSVGMAPASVADLKPGKHQIDVKAPDGYTGADAVEIRAGEITVTRITVEKLAPRDRSRVRIVATHPGGTVKVDSRAPVALPAVFDDLAPGTHFFIVEVEGFAQWNGRKKLELGDNEEIVAELKKGGKVKIVAYNPSDVVELSIDGALIGVTPFDREMPEGKYVITATRIDGKKAELEVNVSAEKPAAQVLRFGDEPLKQLYVEDDEPAVKRLPMSALALGDGDAHFSIMASWPGWAFPLALRGGFGLGSGLSLDFELRTAFDVINELEALVKYTIVSTDSLAFGVEGGIGGGIGGQDRTSFTLRLTAIGSLLIGERAAISLSVGTLFHADNLRPNDDDDRTDESDSGVRLYLGLRTEFRIAEAANLFFLLEADPLSGKRLLYEESFLDDPDPKLYFRAGVSFVF